MPQWLSSQSVYVETQKDGDMVRATPSVQDLREAFTSGKLALPLTKPPSVSSNEDINSGRLQARHPTPRPSITSLDAVTITSSIEDLADQVHGYVRGHTRMRTAIITLSSLVFILVIVFAVTMTQISSAPPTTQLVAAHITIDTTRFKQDRARANIRMPQQHQKGCQGGSELRPWITNRGVALMVGVGFNRTSNRMVINQTGTYMIYSQVVFDKIGAKDGHDPYSDSLFHRICRNSAHGSKVLVHATETPNKVKATSEHNYTAFHTSHIFIVHQLYKGDEIYVKVSDPKLVHLVPKSESIFLGLFKISRAGKDNI